MKMSPTLHRLRKKHGMKKFVISAIFLMSSHLSNADFYDDISESRSEAVHKSLLVSPFEGYNSAISLAIACEYYIRGFSDGIQFGGVFEEVVNEKIFSTSNILKKVREANKLIVKSLNFDIEHQDYTQASYYAVEAYKLACDYEIMLRKKIEDITN